MKLKLGSRFLPVVLALGAFVYPIVNFAAEPVRAEVAAAPQPVAESELKKLFAQYAGLQELSVDFKQLKTLKDIPTKLKSEGHLLVKAPSSLVWTITKPSFLEFKLSGGEIQMTSGKGPDATVQKFSREQMASSPQAKSLDGIASWLKFDPSFLTREYNVVKNADGSLGFSPKNAASSPFSAITLAFAKDQSVKHLALSEKSGDLIELEFEKPKIRKAK